MGCFVIKRLTRDKLAELAELEKLVFSDPWSEKALEFLLNDVNIAFVAVDEKDNVAGYGGMVMVLDEGQIVNIAVHPDYRRQKIGERIVSALLLYGEEKGISSFSLEVRESNAAAISLYEKFNFVSVGVRKNFYSKPTENAIVMIKNIG